MSKCDNNCLFIFSLFSEVIWWTQVEKAKLLVSHLHSSFCFWQPDLCFSLVLGSFHLTPSRHSLKNFSFYFLVIYVCFILGLECFCFPDWIIAFLRAKIILYHCVLCEGVLIILVENNTHFPFHSKPIMLALSC